MDLSRYMTALMKLFLSYFVKKFQSESYCSFLGLLLEFVDDMFDGNMAALVECHDLSLVEQKLGFRQMF